MKKAIGTILTVVLFFVVSLIIGSTVFYLSKSKLETNKMILVSLYKDTKDREPLLLVYEKHYPSSLITYLDLGKGLEVHPLPSNMILSNKEILYRYRLIIFYNVSLENGDVLQIIKKKKDSLINKIVVIGSFDKFKDTFNVVNYEKGEEETIPGLCILTHDRYKKKINITTPIKYLKNFKCIISPAIRSTDGKDYACYDLNLLYFGFDLDQYFEKATTKEKREMLEYIVSFFIG